MSNRHIIAVALVAALVVAPMGTVALSTDTETARSTSTSAVVTGLTVTEPHNTSTDYRLQIAGDTSTNTSKLANPSEAMTVNLTVNDADSEQNGETIYETTQNLSTIVNNKAPDDYYLNISASKWGEDLQYGPNSNITVDVMVTFNATEADVSSTTTTTYVDPNGSDARLEFADDERNVVTQRGLIGATANTLGIGGNDSNAYAADLTDEATVAPNSSTVTLSVDDANAVSAWSAAADDADAGSLSTLGVVVADVNGETTHIPVFVSSADAAWLDSSAPYATVSSDGGAVTVKNAGELVDSTQAVEFSAEGNEAVGFRRSVSMLRASGAGPTTYVPAASSALNLDRNPFSGDD